MTVSEIESLLNQKKKMEKGLEPVTDCRFKKLAEKLLPYKNPLIK